MARWTWNKGEGGPSWGPPGEGVSLEKSESLRFPEGTWVLKGFLTSPCLGRSVQETFPVVVSIQLGDGWGVSMLPTWGHYWETDSWLASRQCTRKHGAVRWWPRENDLSRFPLAFNKISVDLNGPRLLTFKTISYTKSVFLSLKFKTMLYNNKKLLSCVLLEVGWPKKSLYSSLQMQPNLGYLLGILSTWASTIPRYWKRNCNTGLPNRKLVDFKAIHVSSLTI